MKTHNIFLLVAGLFFVACSEDTFTEVSPAEENPANDGITMTVNGYEFDNATRTTIALDGTTLKFNWASGDNVGVFGESKLQQVVLNMESGENTKKATFKSDDYQLVKGKKYVAYYPLAESVAQHADNISLNYTGQEQTANNDLTHLSSYDYIMSEPTEATETNTAAFELNHIGTILRLKLTMPEAGTWQELSLSTEEEAFTTSATIDLFTRKLSDATLSNSVTLNMNNIATTADDNTLTAWIMLSPIDLTGKTVSVSVKSSEKEYVTSFTPAKAYVAGKAYSVSATMGETHTAVDLGLSSGTLWAACNVGASSPEEFGYYFAWGETAPKEDYSISTSTYYSQTVSQLQNSGIIDSDGNLTSNYDAATANWGSGWKMPTYTQVKELIDECTWTTTKQNNVYGYKVTGTNGNSIFLPAAGGKWDATHTVYGAGSSAYYWSSTALVKGPTYAYQFQGYSSSPTLGYTSYNEGSPVRPVATAE